MSICTQGIGLDVLAAVLRQAAPSHVVVLNTGNSSKDLPPGCFWQLPAETQGLQTAAENLQPSSTIVSLPAVSLDGEEDLSFLPHHIAHLSSQYTISPPAGILSWLSAWLTFPVCFHPR